MRPRQILNGSSAGKHLEIADRARPSEGAKDDVIGVGGRLAGDKMLPLDGSAQWIEAGSEGWQPSLTVLPT
jgi:hypothetical protein